MGRSRRPGLSAGRIARLRASLRHLAFASPARFLALGYLLYILAGWLFLLLPVSQAQPLAALDVLFIAVSAVSTTGLVTVDPGASFTLFGEVVILLLILAGGLGYMTVGSFAILALRTRLSGLRQQGARLAFNLPEGFDVRAFVRAVVVFSFAMMGVGAALLWPLFAAHGVEAPLWQAVFHAISAFCTAGFSLFPTSLEAFRADPAINAVIATLSILGATGFLVVVDVWQRLRGEPRPLGFSAAVILRLTGLLIGGGTLFLAFAEPSIAALGGAERWYAAFFQAMTASTTVGFNTAPIGLVSGAAVMVLVLLMLVGASPAGTGGGFKTTSFAILVALMRSVLRRRGSVTLFGRAVPEARQRLALAALGYYLGLLFLFSTLLMLSEAGAAFEVVLFEVVSAMSTVGLSMGLTGGLTDFGKAAVIVLMFAGRVGILTFAIAVAGGEAEDGEGRPDDIVL